MAEVLIWVLRAVGALWAVGGVFVIVQVGRSRALDRKLSEVEAMAEAMSRELGEAPETSKAQEEDDDPGRATWLLWGGALTLASGVGLIVSHPLAMIPLSLLVMHQWLYAERQARRVRRARTAEGAEDAEITPTSRNAAFFAVFVWLAAGLLFAGFVP